MMSTRRLKWVAIVAPVLFWILQLYIRTILFNERRTLAGDIFAVVVIAIGAVIFSRWVFGIIESREREIQRRTEQLAALHSAALALTTELDLQTVLQKVVDLSRSLVNAKYGALGVLDPKGEHIQQFITSGISAEQRRALGEIPTGHGLLGLLIKEGHPIRIPEIARHPRSVGFPPNHPPMHSLLGVPIRSKGRVIGDLYVTDKQPGVADTSNSTVFTQQDQEILEMFATQAAVAVENAQLYRQTQQLAILQERERFGMDLHDGIIQSIYAIGLMLEDTQHRIEAEPQEAVGRITRAIHDLNDVIRDIRNYILELRPQRFQGRDLVRGLEEVAREFRMNTFLDVNVDTNGTSSSGLTAEQTVEVLHVAQEALTNVSKHARATSVNIELKRTGDTLDLSIEDNGIGFNSAQARSSSGNGLRNMKERARALGADIEIEQPAGGGTRVTLALPISENIPTQN